MVNGESSVIFDVVGIRRDRARQVALEQARRRLCPQPTVTATVGQLRVTYLPKAPT